MCIYVYIEREASLNITIFRGSSITSYRVITIAITSLVMILVSFNMPSKVPKMLSVLRQQGAPRRARLQLPHVVPDTRTT